ncbi:TIGR02679 domain-containing protein [Microbispora sp. H10830]|uniref:TIGR02679 domain-containing protein n=1 Tax=Microbispora sp. H10830 TaxID=2729109 RepID=UPI001603FF48|nr:TIGR02679 domain-containing protein [Microbispora sp. H10830]
MTATHRRSTLEEIRRRDPGVQRIRVTLRDLDAAVRAGTELGLAELLEALDGRPLAKRPAEAARTLATRHKALRPAEESALYENAEWYRAWLNAVSRDGASPARWWRIFGGDTARATVVR